MGQSSAGWNVGINKIRRTLEHGFVDLVNDSRSLDRKQKSRTAQRKTTRCDCARPADPRSRSDSKCPDTGRG
ncbi:MAG: hypothetical protein DWI29_00325 [Planctomycetota bacterium]|nr:MAG: hypothetical protein DWI29_00325 [Planctomycetota bacterium]